MSESTIEIPRIDLRTVHAELKKILENHSSRNEHIFAVLRLLIGLTNAAGVAYILREENGVLTLGPRILSRQAMSWHTQLESILIQEVDKSAQTGQVQIRPLDESQQKWVIATPIELNTHKEGMVLVLFLGGQPIEMFVTILQLVAGYAIPQNIESKEQGQWLLALFSTLLAKKSVEESYPILLDTLQTHFDCQRVFFGKVRGRHCQLEAISELGEIKREADLIHTLESYMDSVLVATEQAREDKAKSKELSSNSAEFQPESPKDLGKNLLEDKLKTSIRALTGAEQVLSLPISTDKKTLAILVFLWSKQPADSILSEIRQLSLPLGFLLDTLRRATPNFITEIFTKSDTPLLRRLIITLILACILAILSIPASHKLSGNVVIEPSVRRFVSAPFNGILKHTVRKSGDKVSAGEILARLDEKEIEWNLTGLTADRNRAKKQKDIHAAQNNRADVQMAELEIERLESRIALLEYQIDNLEIKSPIEGIVIRGDLKQVEGSPVTKGQVLFEIAPLDSMRVELAVIAEDVVYIRHGMPIKMKLEAYPLEQWFLEVNIIHPRSTVKGAGSVFIVEANLKNADGKLRPGMQGKGKVIADKHILGWILFHRVWEKIILWWR
jgi:multidrug resistance efflux pump